jgi:type I restriction enzyme M protein
LRKQLVENNELQGVVSLPAGAFKPYAGVSTAILFLTKGSKTDHVWFYDLKEDGFSLDDKRTPITANDLPDLVKQFKARDKSVAETEANDRIVTDSKKHFWVSKADIVTNKYDLSINRYKQVVYVEDQYDDPKNILDKLVSLENVILADLKALEKML